MLIADGDESAFEEMYLHYFKRYFTYGKKITDNIILIEDAIHDVMYKIWQNRKSIPEIKNPAAYFYASYRNSLYDKLKEKQFVEPELENEGSKEISSEDILIKKEIESQQMNRLKDSFSELTPRQLEAVLLRFYHELSYEDVADILGITVKATYKLIARSLEKLKNEFLPALLIMSVLNVIKPICYIFL